MAPGEMMTNLWTDPAGPLRKLAEALEVDSSELAESPDEITYRNEEFASSRLKLPASLDVLDKILLGLWEKYGPALTLRFNAGALPRFQLADGYQRKNLDELYGENASETLILDLKIDKNELLSRWNFTDPSVIFKIFFFHDELIRALRVPLPELENGLMKSAVDQKLMILVPDHNIELDGDYLAVLGGDSVAEWRNHLPTKSLAELRERLVTVSKLADARPKWVHFELRHITPLHLIVTWKEKKPGRDDRIAGTLYAQLFACSLLYMASRSTRNGTADSFWAVTFASDRCVVTLDIGDITALRVALTTANADPWKIARTLGQRAAWLYEDSRYAVDRFTVVQHVFASSLAGKASLSELVHQVEEIDKRVQGGWDSFLSGELDKYFAHVKQLEETIDATTKSYNEQVQTLAKSLIDNMVAAVAVVVGSFIAAIFKSPFQEYVFRTGTGVYAVYLITFPICVGLTASWQRFKESQRTFRKRRADFRRRLTPKWVDDTVGSTVRDREGWFKKWFRSTATLYVLVVVLLTWAMVAVPNQIRSWSDRFTLTNVSYGAPASGLVPMTIRGEDFDKDKEIVVTIDGTKFTNTDGQTLKVHGSTVLILSPRLQDLTAVTQKQKDVFFTVQQGTLAQTMELPKPPAP